jgi:hypothetical protein
MIKYLIRAKKRNPNLPAVFPASKAPIPPKKESIKTMEAVNRFVRDNPRTEKAGGGMLVQPGFGGTRQGYASGKAVKGFDNVFESSPGSKTYVYRRGKKENEIYRGGFKTPEAASKWGKKEFVKKFALPNKFVSAAQLSEILGVGSEKGSGMASPLFERGDRPKYLLQEARKILGSYQAGKSNFFRAPTKKEIEYLKKYYKAPRITEGLAKNVQIILNSKAIMNDLTGKNKGGAKLPEFNKVIQVFKNAGVNASDAQITNALQKAAYLLRGDTFQTDVKYDVDKNTGRFIIKELEKLPFDNQYARGIYKHALNEIRLELGETAGNLESFKRNLRKRLPEGFLQKHGLEINEIFSVRASAKNQSFPYAYFLDATDAEINKKALRSFHGALSKAQTNLNNKIADIRAGKAKYDEAVDIIKKFQKTRSKFKNTIETNYPGKNFNLADIVLGKESEVLKKNMKIPEDVYSKKLLDKWKNQGLDITGHAKKTGYVMTGADNPGVFTAQDLSKDKAIRDSFIKQVSVLGGGDCGRGLKNQGGRVGLQDGTPNIDVCYDRATKRINSGFKNATPAEARNYTKLLNAVKGSAVIGRNLLKFGIVPEALYVGADSLIRMGYGDTFKEAGLRAADFFIPGDQMQEADKLKVQRTLGDAAATNVGRVFDYRNQIANIDSLEQQKQNFENLSGGGAFDYVGDLSQDVKNIDTRLNQAKNDLQNKFMVSEAETVAADRALEEAYDISKAKSPLARLKSFAQNIEAVQDDPFLSDIATPQKTQMDLNLNMFPTAIPTQTDFMKMTDTDIMNRRRDLINAGVTNLPSSRDLMSIRDAEIADREKRIDEFKAMPLMDAANQFGKEQVFGTQGTFFGEPIIKTQPRVRNTSQDIDPFQAAGGGIAKLAGDRSGPPPESGPNSQGLQGLMKRVRNL